MAKQPLGVTFVDPATRGALGVYEAPNGIEIIEQSGPYLLDDGRTLVTPVEVFAVTGTTFVDADGDLHQAVPVIGASETPPDGGITWDANTTWDNSTYWS